MWMFGRVFMAAVVIVVWKCFEKLWLRPMRVQREMRAQGVRGPGYKLIEGNSREIFDMRVASMSQPMELSHRLLPRIQPYVHTWIQTYGTNYLQWDGLNPQLVVTDAEMIKEVLNDKDGAYVKPEPPVYFRKLFGDGLPYSAGEKWAKSRKISTHAFNGESLKASQPSAELMLEGWRGSDGKEIEVYGMFKLFTADVISRTAFGSSYEQGKNMFEMLSELTLIAVRNSFKNKLPVISKFWRSADDAESERLENEVKGLVLKMVRSREEKVLGGEASGYGDDFLGLLLKASHDADESRRIGAEAVVDECKTFYVAGSDTSNTLLTWTVFLMALHTEWQEEARKEVFEHFGGGKPHPDGLSRLKTMSMIINECLRLYPPTPGFLRHVEKRVTLGNLELPHNLNIFISTLALHHDTKIWGKEAQVFNPGRFSEGVARATDKNIAAFFPFGIGPRTCVGSHFAVMEAKIAIAMILQRYKFTLSPNYVHSPRQFITIRPQLGVQIIITATNYNDAEHGSMQIALP
uniref:Cytochrome P450 n=1 Tax=Kalanchoe fedtschenkoi TaxID=63787 RepID=A0A7N0UL31_KALFE